MRDYDFSATAPPKGVNMPEARNTQEFFVNALDAITERVGEHSPGTAKMSDVSPTSKMSMKKRVTVPLQGLKQFS